MLSTRLYPFGNRRYCWRTPKPDKSWFYNGAANGIITRAKTEVLVFSRSTRANQSATRSKLIAAAVAKCWRCVFDLPIYRDLLIPKARTPCEIVPSIPDLFLYSFLYSSVFSRSRACRNASCNSCGLMFIVLLLLFALVHWERLRH